jgi:hypothetical protein
MDLATTATAVGVGKDITLAIAAALTSAVAVIGLRSWRRELRGKADFTTAQDMARAMYKLREAMATCRAPWFDVSEFPPGYDGRSKVWSDEAKAYTYLFQNRWTPVWEAAKAFDVAISDAEVLWGSAIRSKANDLKACVVTLRASIDAYIRNKAEGGSHFETDERYAALIQSEVTSPREEVDNPLTRRIDSAVSAIEADLRPHLSRAPGRHAHRPAIGATNVADDINQQRWLETYKSLINISIEGFKFLALANGGAAVALLAYLGNRSPPGGMVCPIVAFALGVAACGVSMLCAYLTQLTLFNELSAGRTGRPLRHQWLLWLAIALVALSLAAFVAGSILAAERFASGRG